MTDPARILVIDDDAAVQSSLSLLLRQRGFGVATADGPGQAEESLRLAVPNLCVLDMNFSMATTGNEGLRLLADIRRQHPLLPVILITAWGSIPLAVEGMKAGASDFITKPWNNDRFVQSVQTALRLSAASTTAASSRDELDAQFDFGGIVGRDETMLAVLRTVGRVAGTDASVLIEGDSGTGKELIAEALHNNSSRAEGPFVRVNLGGIPTGLFESEMFGHRRGAFTGAVADRIGRFAQSDKGTIFLDEIGELDTSSQVKLLRVLQDRTFEPLGSSDSKTADFRLVCATNRDLRTMVAQHRFREDLFYRINLITLRLPPLRERAADIPLLVNFFVTNFKAIYRRESLHVTPRALRWLGDCPWPGNIRELKNLVERTLLVSNRDELDVEDFQAHMSGGVRPNGDNLPAVGTVTIEEMEHSMIRKALAFHDGNLSKVARALGLSRAALYRRLEKYGIAP